MLLSILFAPLLTYVSVLKLYAVHDFYVLLTDRQIQNMQVLVNDSSKVVYVCMYVQEFSFPNQALGNIE